MPGAMGIAMPSVMGMVCVIGIVIVIGAPAAIPAWCKA